jgi:hypothetical protein
LPSCPTGTATRQVAAPSVRPLPQLHRGWRLAFQSGRGAPEGERSTGLTDWARSDDPAIRFFSGTADYRNTLSLPKGWKAGSDHVLLDLGDVKDVAEVFVNGLRAGVAWKAPYRVDVTALLKPGANAITVRVANLWVNRLIGDAQPGATPHAFTTGLTYAPGAPLRPSGLLGPVRLMISTSP